MIITSVIDSNNQLSTNLYVLTVILSKILSLVFNFVLVLTKNHGKNVHNHIKKKTSKQNEVHTLRATSTGSLRYSQSAAATASASPPPSYGCCAMTSLGRTTTVLRLSQNVCETALGILLCSSMESGNG